MSSGDNVELGKLELGFALDNHENALRSHKEGTAVVTLSKAVEDSVFEKVITDEGYKVDKR